MSDENWEIPEFISWFGDGEVFGTFPKGPPPYARDLVEAVAREVLGRNDG